MENKVIKNNIKELRKRRGLTQQQLAEKLGISQVHFGRLETNARSMDLEQVEKIASALGVKPFDILPQEWQPSSAPCNSEDLAMIIELVENQLQATHIVLSPQEKAKLIVILLEMAQEQPANENLKKEFEKTISLYSRVVTA